MKQARITLFMIAFGGFSLLILGRFFYWQVIKGEELSSVARRQRIKVSETQASRGTIYTRGNYPLVINKPAFDLSVYLPNLNVSKEKLAEKVAPILADKNGQEAVEATKSAILSTLFGDREWLVLEQKLPPSKKSAIEKLDLGGVDFKKTWLRDYPEASMAANLVGFVGSDQNGESQGYFGLEGNYHQQLVGQPGLLIEETNPFGETILSGGRIEEKVQPGMNLTLHLERAVQFVLENELKAGIEKHGAKSGWAVVMNPKTGAIWGMANFPNYDPAKFSQYNKELYSNPVVAEGFEPGSVFKPLIMAAAIEEDVVQPDTVCTACDGPLTIGDQTIKTWNDKYHPNSTMTEVIVNSDNVGMAFVGQKLGKKHILKYLNKFGFGQKTGIDLEEEAKLSIRPAGEWYPIDIAAVSFGQGVSVTPIQLTTAFASLANGGQLVVPRVVSQIRGRSRKPHLFEPKIVGHPISKETTKVIKKMLVSAVEKGPVKWTKLDNLVVAGKTGTAQIAIAGHYDEEKTFASFIGFAPVKDPKFVMLVSLREPQSSPWGAETAAPVWFNIAEKLSYYWNL